jgi:2-polyprenyl-6-hydroxyphenyl methylase/3-demethylubiquinone-9 3-methyltransferase
VSKATLSLWFDGDAEEAARFYTGLFPDSEVLQVNTSPADYPAGKAGDVLTVEFTICGLPCLGINGGAGVRPNEAFSLQIETADQAETDRYWNAIVGNDGEEIQCSWCKDRWGYHWQIVPLALNEGLRDPDAAAARRVMEAMMAMKKIDVEVIEAARRG